MKSNLKIFFILALLFFAVDSSFAQKVGHVSITEVIQLMPETTAANKELETLGNTYRDELEMMEVDLRNKLLAYENGRATWAEEVSTEKFNDLQALSEKLDERTAEVEKEFQQKQDDKLAPIFEKARNAVSKVAKENGVACIFDARMLLYADEAAGFDLLPLVKKELGVK